MKAKRIKTLSWASMMLFAALVTITLGQRTAAADSDPSSRVARLDYLRGSVSFQPAGERDWVSARINRPVTTGDRLWADDNSRVEMQLGSATIRMDEQTGISFINLDDRTTQIELSEGVLNVRVLRLDRNEIFEIDTPNQAFSIERPGQYRIEVSEDGNSTLVTVRSGEGEVTGAGRTYTIGTGATGSFVEDDRLRVSIYKARAFDDFDRWSQDRDRRDDGAKSVRYVSREVVGYQDLDDYGYWQYVSGYGYVWYPRVSAVWAPYHDGHWAWISPWGWTWIDEAPWGYAPFHYGRWVIVRNNWAWIPGPMAVRPVYAPALVAFIGGPQFNLSVSLGGSPGYVGWFPLGPREVYVPTYRTSREYVERVNVSNTTVNNITITNVYNNSNNTNVRYVNKTARGGVTAVSQTTFINAQHVGKSAVVVSQKNIESAPISRRAEVPPSRNSVLGPLASETKHVSTPRSEVMNRTVVVKTPPPAPPVPFERQQARLAAQPGQPLASKELESLRPTNADSGRSHVRQAPPGKPAIADSTQAPVNTPAQARSSGRTSENNRQPVPMPVTPAVAVPAHVENAPSRGNNRPPSSNTKQSAPTPAKAAPATPPAVAPAQQESAPSRNNNRPPGNNRGQSASVPAKAAPVPQPREVPAQEETLQARGNNRPEAKSGPAQSEKNSSPGKSSESRGGEAGRQATPTPSPATPIAAPASSNSQSSRGNRGQSDKSDK